MFGKDRKTRRHPKRDRVVSRTVIVAILLLFLALVIYWLLGGQVMKNVEDIGLNMVHPEEETLTSS